MRRSIISLIAVFAIALAGAAPVSANNHFTEANICPGDPEWTEYVHWYQDTYGGRGIGNPMTPGGWCSTDQTVSP